MCGGVSGQVLLLFVVERLEHGIQCDRNSFSKKQNEGKKEVVVGK